ncbi:hypothetical protein SKAU_G00263530 [Synaphobranchus kaupii]|uniref:Uncharacterized protein n=1 Tax=Synaphobranchus kaupii TaxID=118154 RepID=A0A9Q1EZ54_SYNKA|nr:hypothetical protein SKAU_G00263530 [Synaphobranchus kaupii]
MEYTELTKEYDVLLKEHIELKRTIKYLKKENVYLKATREAMKSKHRTAHGFPLPNPECRAEGLSNLQLMYGAFKLYQAEKERTMRGGFEPTQPSPAREDFSEGLEQAHAQSPVPLHEDVERLQQDAAHTGTGTTDSVSQGATAASEDRSWAPLRCVGRLLNRCKSILFNKGKDRKLMATPNPPR